MPHVYPRVWVCSEQAFKALILLQEKQGFGPVNCHNEGNNSGGYIGVDGEFPGLATNVPRDNGLYASENYGSDGVYRAPGTVVMNDGTVKNRRGINVPGIELSFDFISEKDKADIIFGCQQDVNFIAASFVRRPQDVLDVKRLLVDVNTLL